MGHSKSSPKKEAHSTIGLPQEEKSNPTSKRIRKATTTKMSRVSSRKEIMMIRAEINDTGLKKQHKR